MHIIHECAYIAERYECVCGLSNSMISFSANGWQHINVCMSEYMHIKGDLFIYGNVCREVTHKKYTCAPHCRYAKSNVSNANTVVLNLQSIRTYYCDYTAKVRICICVYMQNKKEEKKVKLGSGVYVGVVCI